jgi:methionyl aminopeptidase
MITIKSKAEMDKMRQAGKILIRFFEEIEPRVVPGVTTSELDKFAEKFILSQKGKLAFKGYHGFPATICASVNEEVVHGMPGKRKLAEGDIIGIDVGAIVDGFYADAARTFAVGQIDPKIRDLMKVTRESLEAGVRAVKPGNRISDISHAVESAVKPHGYGIVRQYVGHGIGSQLHEEPQIPNYGKPGQGAEIKPGMAFAIEPMINAGTHEVKLCKDGWTVVTADGRPSAHFENTVLVTETGAELITQDA